MDNNQRALSHFGVPGMRWGKRNAARYEAKSTKALAKAKKLDLKGDKEGAANARENAKIFKKRVKNVKELAAMGQQIRNGTSFMGKVFGADAAKMINTLSKGKYTKGEMFVSSLVQGSYNTLAALKSNKITEG